jgi:hypothetical protein
MACAAASWLAAGCSGSDEPAPAPPPAVAPPTNAAPTVRPGGAQAVLAGNPVQLDGSASTDPDGNPLSYRWSLVERPLGSSAVLTGPATPRPSFFADVVGSYVFSLVVNDGQLDSTTGLVTVTASLGNVAPVARVGLDQTTIPGATVTVDGSGSSDANGDVLSFRWTLSRPAGSNAMLTDPAAERTSFVPDLVGRYAVSLQVSDGLLSSNAQPLVVTVVNANVPPVADAGAAQRVLTGSAVTLDGSRSSDANGDRLNYVWSLVSRPAGSTASLGSRNAPTTGLVADVEGVYVVSLVVNDGNADSAAATVSVSAFDLRPLPTGAGTWAQATGATAFSALDENTGTATAAVAGCGRFVAADTGPDGTVLALATGGRTLTRVDLRAGVCAPAFAVAETVLGLAVAADGSVHLLTQASSGLGARFLLRLDREGLLLGRVELSGSSRAAPGTEPLLLRQAETLDLLPDGSLLLLEAGAAWRVDPLTGAGTLQATGLVGSGDIDIDTAGQLRRLDGGRLVVTDTAGWTTLRTLPLSPAAFGPSALVRR